MSTSHPQAGQRPTVAMNMLFLMTDQQSLSTLGCYGNDVIHTPNIDRIAASGGRWSHCFTPTAICTPARASLLTGLHPFRHRLLANPEWNTACREELDDDAPAFSRELRAAGYNLGHVGKWHVGKDLGPDHYGYDADHFAGALIPAQHPLYLQWLQEQSLDEPQVHDPVRGQFADGSPGHLLAGRLDHGVEATFEKFLTDRALGLLKQYLADFAETGRPFHLAMHYFGPHLPYLVPDRYYDMYDPADVVLPDSMAETFAGKPPVQRHYSDYWTVDSFDMDEWRKLIAVHWGYVTMLDEQIGRLLDVLDQADISASTATVFTADHGEFTGAHRLNDKGPAMYDDIYRVPLLMSASGIEPGAVIDDFVALTDLAPTIRQVSGLDPVEPCDGRVLPTMRHRQAPWNSATDRYVVAEFHGHHFPYPQRMVRTDAFKLVINPESVNELYDLRHDPDELHNVYELPRMRRTRRQLTHQLYEELQLRGDGFFKWMRFTADLDRTKVKGQGIPAIDGWDLDPEPVVVT